MKLERKYISGAQLGKTKVIGIKLNGEILYKYGVWSMAFAVEGLADKHMPKFNSDFSYDITRDGYYDSDDLFYGTITISAKTENSYPIRIDFYGTWGCPDAIKSIDRIDYIDEVSISFMNCSNATSINTSELVNINYAYPSNGIVAGEHGIFSNCYALRELSTKKLDTSGMKSMEAMFRNCRSLQTLDLSNFDTSQVTSMRNMFYNCNSLRTLDASSFDTSNMTDGSSVFLGMFENCTSLIELDLSSFNLDAMKKNRSFDRMFYNCTSLQILDLSNFVTEAGVYSHFLNAFGNCNNLREIRLDNCSYKFINDMLSSGDLPDNEIEGVTKTIYCKKSEAYGVTPSFLGIWILSCINDMPDSEGISRFEPHEFYNNKEITEVTTMVDEYNKYLACMFMGCSNLVSVNTQGWDTSNVNTMFAMFNSCSSLEEVGTSNFNTANVTDMQYMFSGCESLTTLDLSNWDTSKVTSMFQMFYNCSLLEEVDMRNFDTSNVTNIYQMFGNCNNLHTLYLNNCNADTINKIITSSNFPADNTGTIYCSRTAAAELTAPGNWQFSYID